MHKYESAATKDYLCIFATEIHRNNDYYRTATIIRRPSQCRRHVQAAKEQFRPSPLLQRPVRFCRFAVFVRAGTAG